MTGLHAARCKLWLLPVPLPLLMPLVVYADAVQDESCKDWKTKHLEHPRQDPHPRAPMMKIHM
jgi:hypothetical protein